MSKYFPIVVVLVAIISSVTVALWTGNHFASADTVEITQTADDVSIRILMTLEGEQQGLIKGDVMDSGKEGYIECSSYRHSVITPLDESSGTLIGERQHRPVRITKRIDQATPLLLKAWVTNEKILSLSLEFYRIDASGGEPGEHYFTVRIENGYVAGVTQLSEDAEMGGEAAPPMGGFPIEEVTFVYSKIIWTYILNGNSSDDSWDNDSRAA
jgi:type VI secretion system secreted protein Hcp